MNTTNENVNNVNTNYENMNIISPNNNLPIRMNLTNLTPDELMGTILSTKFNPDFVPATVNTIILKHWNDIFSKTLFNWEVVLKKPDHVKLHFINSTSCLLCRPYKKIKCYMNLYYLIDAGELKKIFLTEKLCRYSRQ